MSDLGADSLNSQCQFSGDTVMVQYGYDGVWRGPCPSDGRVTSSSTDGPTLEKSNEKLRSSIFRRDSQPLLDAMILIVCGLSYPSPVQGHLSFSPHFVHFEEHHQKKIGQKKKEKHSKILIMYCHYSEVKEARFRHINFFLDTNIEI